MQKIKHSITFLVLADPAIFAAFPITLAILLDESFPGGLFSEGTWKGFAFIFPGVFFNVFLLCLLKCASCKDVSSLLS